MESQRSRIVEETYAVADQGAGILAKPRNDIATKFNQVLGAVRANKTSMYCITLLHRCYPNTVGEKVSNSKFGIQSWMMIKMNERSKYWE